MRFLICPVVMALVYEAVALLGAQQAHDTGNTSKDSRPGQIVWQYDTGG
jgi:hypothetical protein